MSIDEEHKRKIYLPAEDGGLETGEFLKRYIEDEFPSPESRTVAVYSIPRVFQKDGEQQARLAENEVFNRLQNVGFKDVSRKFTGMWTIYFHGAFYAGHSFRNRRLGKLMIREHDFVVFTRHNGKCFVVFIEVKSTNDQQTDMVSVERFSDAKIIKNNKRSAKHQLRDHMEVLQNVLGMDPQKAGIQSYIMWPFLGSHTKNPQQQPIRRWKDDDNLHVFNDAILVQEKFDRWFFDNILSGTATSENNFVTLLNRFITLSCGVFVDEINTNLMALLTQEQLLLLNSDICQRQKAVVVHGAAGTGKTLLVLRKLEQLHQCGRLDERNRALYICYWPGIRCEMEVKLEILGIRQYVDTARFYISISHFLDTNKNAYRHVFMDESEALCLALDGKIIHNTFSAIYDRHHAGNCELENCEHSALQPHESIFSKMEQHPKRDRWGELWFLVDINQASLFLPKHSPQILKNPSVRLSKVMRSTGRIFRVFKQFYTVPMPLLPKEILRHVDIPDIFLGHNFDGPPVYWMDSKKSVDSSIAKVIVDLCSTKGFRPCDLCVLPFLINERLVPECVNKHIDELFVENSYRPCAVGDVEYFLRHRENNSFLMTWALKVKGLEFKVVVMAVDGDDFDIKDPEDRKKAYIIASRCTCLLILVSSESIKRDMDVGGCFKCYPFAVNIRI